MFRQKNDDFSTNCQFDVFFDDNSPKHRVRQKAIFDGKIHMIQWFPTKCNESNFDKLSSNHSVAPRVNENLCMFKSSRSHDQYGHHARK